MADRGDKRMSVQPKKLTYHGLGQQAETTPKTALRNTSHLQQPGTSTQAINQEHDVILAGIAEAQRKRDIGEKKKTEALKIISQFDGKQEDDLTDEEIATWRQAKTDANNSGILIKLMDDELIMLRRRLLALEPGVNAVQVGQSVVINGSKSKAGSSCSSAQMAKQVQLHTKKEALDLKIGFTNAKRDIRRKVQGLEEIMKRSKDPNELETFQLQLESLNAKADQLQCDFNEDMELLKEAEELELQKIEVECDEDQKLGSDDDEEMRKCNLMSDWVQRSNKQLDTGGLFTPKPHHFGFQTQSAGNYRHPVSDYEEHSEIPPPSPTNIVADLTSALKDAFREVRGDKEWDPRELPTFNGKAEDWPIFINEFRRTTPQAKTNTSQNAIRLRKALKGSAREAVVGLLNEPNNVEKILETLEERFGRKELIIQALTEKAEQCKSPDPQKPDTFVAFGTNVQHLIQTVKSLKETRYLNDIGLMNKLVSKLPVVYAREWLQWLHSDRERSENLLSFSDWLDINMKLNVRLYKPVVKEDNFSGRNARASRGSARVNTVTAEEQKISMDSRKQNCNFCEKSNHPIGRCYLFKKKTLEERMKFVKDKSLCFRCLSSTHIKRDCNSTAVRDKNDCGRDHHPLLHMDGKLWKDRTPKPNQDPPDDERNMKVFLPQHSPAVNSNIGVVTTQQSKPMSVVKIRIKGPKGVRKVYAMLDSGANTTMVDSALAEELGLLGKKILNKCHIFGGKETTTISKDVAFEIGGNFRTAKLFAVKEALTYDSMNLQPYSQDADRAKQQWKYLRRAKLESFSNVIPQVLIGEDQAYLTAHRELLQGEYNQPVAKRTLLGWVLGGQQLHTKDVTNINVLTVGETEHLDTLIKDHFSLDSYGIYPKTTVGSVEDQRSLKILEETTRKIGNGWEVALLWRNENVKLPSSWQQAESRLVSNERRMLRNPDYCRMYHSKIEEYFAKGYIRELSSEEANAVTDRTFYIPHFGVFNVNKPGKLRIVFDAACKNGGISLNDHLMTGPDLIRPLPTVLFNFRKWNYVINGDIEDMFHRVAVRPQDQNSQRFLWRDLKEDTEKRSIKILVMQVLMFGACSSPAEAIYIKDVNASQFEKDFPEAVRAVKEDFYSDDCLSGAQTEDEAIQLRKEITDICAAGNFNIRKWLSNSKRVITSIPEQDRAAGSKGFGDKEEIPLERVLGLWWDPEADEFTFSANFKKVSPKILRGERPTKREMCALLMSVFDPLGFIAHFKIKGLILLQRTWRTEVGWDDYITDSIFEEWRKWVENLRNTENIRVPRGYIHHIHLATDIQLHTLVDASEEATSAASYLRVKHGEDVSISFVFGKAKVAPNKKLTIPRLELIAAVMGVCQADTITKDLRVNINSRYFWSDSRLVLMWIRTETRRHKEFVANRVNRIQLLSSVKEWRWVPTTLNVVDQGTRLHSKIELTRDSKWLQGPDFLRDEPEAWPTEDRKEEVTDDEDEVRHSTATVVSITGHPYEAGVFVNINRFSDYGRLIRAQSAVIRAARYWLNRVRNIKSSAPWNLKSGSKLPNVSKPRTLSEHLTTYTSPEDYMEAENMLIRFVQLSVFEEEIRALSTKHGLAKSSKIFKLRPFIDDGFLKIAGRIGAANVPEEMKNPIILPTYHRFTELQILKEHERFAHQGHATVLNEIRKRFWIIHARAAIRNAIGKCQPCKLAKARPVIPSMGSLPYYRLVTRMPAFTYTGVDLMGPIEVVVGRHHEKRWVAIFTCMVTRAVHIEVVYGLSTDETVMALSRFISSRGRNLFVFSDNGTNFVGTKKELELNWNSMDWSTIMNLDKFRKIKWEFTPPHAPHFGGAWERMVQSVKKILRKTLKETFPKDQKLLTLLKEAENIINSRPLTYASDAPSDFEPLTPNHFIRGQSDVGPSIPGDFKQDNASIRTQWRRSQHFVEMFWKQWTEEVLPELIRRDKWYQDTTPLEKGELVLLVNEQGPRNTWKRGVITKTFPGGDDQVRVVLVETVDIGTKKKTTYKRAVEKVIPLGLRMENQEQP